MPRARGGRGARPVPARPSLPTVTGDRVEQDAARVSVWPSVSPELLPDVPVRGVRTAHAWAAHIPAPRGSKEQAWLEVIERAH